VDPDVAMELVLIIDADVDPDVPIEFVEVIDADVVIL
jgi:hypothetical protein